MKGIMKQEIKEVLTSLNIQPVLMDVGASGAPPPQWAPIAEKAIYIGFDPDQRDLQDIPDGQYARSIIINKAVTSVVNQGEVLFYLTHSPYCSSTLLPDRKSLEDYLFADYFVVEREAKVSATTLNGVIESLKLQSVDWFKSDSQGTDLRLFQSLDPKVRDGVLAVDMEPGIIDAYMGEDLFVDAHRELTRQGFWLCSLDVKGTVRMRRSTFEAIAQQNPQVQDSLVYQTVRPSPGWCEARYLRTLESLNEQNAEQRSYALLWVFATIEQQWGYALDIAKEYQQKFGDDAISAHLFDTAYRQLLRDEPQWRFMRFIKRILPQDLKTNLKRMFAK